ncbi:hypothetical protein SDJN03_07953, partial [Cucurbita argyrosperma subsp. sororia]
MEETEGSGRNQRVLQIREGFEDRSRQSRFGALFFNSSVTPQNSEINLNQPKQLDVGDFFKTVERMRNVFLLRRIEFAYCWFDWKKENQLIFMYRQQRSKHSTREKGLCLLFTFQRSSSSSFPFSSV